MLVIDKKSRVFKAMQKMLAGMIRLEDIPNLATQQERIGAAVAYLHLSGEYIDEEGVVLVPFSPLLMKLTDARTRGEAPDSMTGQSRMLGLHSSTTTTGEGGKLPPGLRRRVTLTPLEELGLTTNASPNDKDRAEEIVEELLANESPWVILAVQMLLGSEA